MTRPGHDLVVVGASAGGIEALQRMAARLPGDLPAAVLVVLHVTAAGPSALPEILRRAGALPAAHALDGERLERGRILVAPPDHHLLIDDGHVRVTRGPKENSHRPAIDPLFRSAATAAGPRAIGVILSGMLDDGAAGIAAVKAAGGVAIVQDPDDATYSSMPRSALRAVDPDEIVGSRLLGPAIARWVATPADAPKPPPGEVSDRTCPTCGGTLRTALDDGPLRYRCRVGHAWSAESLSARNASALGDAPGRSGTWERTPEVGGT